MKTDIWGHIGANNGLVFDVTKLLPEPTLSYHLLFWGINLVVAVLREVLMTVIGKNIVF